MKKPLIKEIITSETENSYITKDWRKTLKEKTFIHLKQTIYVSDKLFEFSLKTFDKYQKEDNFCKNPCTVEAIIKILDQYKNLMKIIKSAPELEKNKLFAYIYNCTIQVYNFSQFLKKSFYSSVVVEYLIIAVDLLRTSYILNKPKFLEWSLKLNIEIVKLFEENNKLVEALGFIENSLEDFVRQKKKHIRDHKRIKENYNNLEIMMKALALKYRFLLGKDNIGQVKQRLNEVFENKKFMVFALVEIISIEMKAKDIKMFPQYLDFKKNLIKFIFEFIQDDLKELCDTLKKKKNMLIEEEEIRLKPKEEETEINEKSEKEKKNQKKKKIQKFKKSVMKNRPLSHLQR